MSNETLREFAAGIRGEGITVNFSGLWGGEFVTRTLDRLAGVVADVFEPGSDLVGGYYDRVTEASRSAIREVVGVEVSEQAVDVVERPPLELPDGFRVVVPSWQEVFVAPGFGLDDPQYRRQKAIEEAERLASSPTPPNVRRMAEILTTLDDLQDDAATLAVVLALLEKGAGRAIPGVGQVALAADALNFVSAFLAPAGGSGLPGKMAKRQAVESARSSSGGYGARVEELRRTGDFRLGWGDLIQGLQSTGNWFGFGIQLGGLVAGVQDAAFGLLRGAEFQIPTRLPGVVGIGQDLLSAYYRSPSLMDLSPMVPDIVSTLALRVLGGMSRVAPWLDRLSEPALAWSLVGSRLAENVLGPWLRSGSWVDPVRAIVNRDFEVGGSELVAGDGRLRTSSIVPASSPATTAAIIRAIGNVPSRARQVLYEQMVSSIGYGLMADFEPEARVLEHRPIGAFRDAFNLLDVGMIPRFDLGE